MKSTSNLSTVLNENIYRHRHLLSNYFVIDILFGVWDALIKESGKDDCGLMVLSGRIMEACENMVCLRNCHGFSRMGLDNWWT